MGTSRSDNRLRGWAWCASCGHESPRDRLRSRRQPTRRKCVLWSTRTIPAPLHSTPPRCARRRTSSRMPGRVRRCPGTRTSLDSTPPPRGTRVPGSRIRNNPIGGRSADSPTIATPERRHARMSAHPTCTHARLEERRTKIHEMNPGPAIQSRGPHRVRLRRHRMHSSNEF